MIIVFNSLDFTKPTSNPHANPWSSWRVVLILLWLRHQHWNKCSDFDAARCYLTTECRLISYSGPPSFGMWCYPSVEDEVGIFYITPTWLFDCFWLKLCYIDFYRREIPWFSAIPSPHRLYSSLSHPWIYPLPTRGRYSMVLLHP